MFTWLPGSGVLFYFGGRGGYFLLSCHLRSRQLQEPAPGWSGQGSKVKKEDVIWSEWALVFLLNLSCLALSESCLKVSEVEK